MTRPSRVYRLRVVDVPPGASPPVLRRTRYLTRSGALHAAAVLRDRGVTATVQASNPITWPTDTEETKP